ncbi:hydrogen gas-evolving membrane-bound hydrogenase subunit E, partial [Streptomyces sp. SPB074]|uniref:hydrogen gas-evolving membrane-bound hydrogenase subunit E n=1 Tax=Streptomyces sp. (strain SPB074) TaxID=465543 RepID=UPI002D21D1C2
AHHGLKDVVATILVDLRAWDTMGESAVLAAAAIGVTSLIYLHRRTESDDLLAAGPRGGAPTPVHTTGASPGTREPSGATRWTAWTLPHHDLAGLPEGDETAPERTWLAAGKTLAPEHRSVIFEVVARLVYHPILVLSVYLLFCAENMPGGGFVAGLVAGVAFIIRYLAGGRFELAAAAPFGPGLLTGLGLFVSTGVALGGLAGGTVLHGWTWHGHWPVFGEVHLSTAVLFDCGVYLLVLGVVLDLVRALGAKIDRQIERLAALRAARREGGAR